MSSLKRQALRASVPDIRQSMEMANEFMHAGVPFVCVPYFDDTQKIAAAALAASNLDSVCFEDDSNEQV